jgi:hypothetical protein
LQIADEPETAAKRIKSENNYIIMKAEDGPELIILDDDDDVSSPKSFQWQLN